MSDAQVAPIVDGPAFTRDSLNLADAIEVDTAHCKGNFPARCSIQAAGVGAGTPESLVTQSMLCDVTRYADTISLS